MESNTTEILCRVANIIAILAIVLCAIGDFLVIAWPFIISGIFKVFVFIMLILLEFKACQASFFIRPFSFMFYYAGRGIFYIMFALTTTGLNIVTLVGDLLLIIIGICYIITHFVSIGNEPDFMSFSRYHSVTRTFSHDLPAPAMTENTYNLANQPSSPMSANNQDVYHNETVHSPHLSSDKIAVA